MICTGITIKYDKSDAPPPASFAAGTEKMKVMGKNLRPLGQFTSLTSLHLHGSYNSTLTQNLMQLTKYDPARFLF
jgi:hypothetical protein